MPRTFLHLGISSEITPADKSSIERRLNKARDWFRYAPNCWIVYTAQPAKVWYERLKELPEMKEKRFFICEINLENRAGWLPTSAWEWLKKDRS